MKKSELRRAIQNEINRRGLSTFMSKEHKIVQTGCSTCQRHFGAVEQFKFHIPTMCFRFWIGCLRLDQNDIHQSKHSLQG